MRYDSDLLYRPPGEWKSYLLQCTISSRMLKGLVT